MDQLPGLHGRHNRVPQYIWDLEVIVVTDHHSLLANNEERPGRPARKVGSLGVDIRAGDCPQKRETP